jgi:hypothetical protein
VPRKKNNPDRDPRPESDRPWNEEEWEAFMKDGDLRAARFGEILETVMDHPDRDALIDRHMGWDEPDEPDEADESAGDDPDHDPDFDPEAIMEQAAAEVAAEKAERERLGLSSPDDSFDEEEEEEDIIPAYKLAREVGLRVHAALKPFMEARTPDDVENWDRDDIDEKLGEAYIGCMIAAAKIAGGHAMGYEDDVLCGNIANVKRGLAGADQCEQAMLFLREQGTVPAEVVDKLLPDVRAVQQAVRERIDELREGVWW